MIVAKEQADLVSIAREVMLHPNWPAEAALALKGASACPRSDSKKKNTGSVIGQ
jgi:2,4-dienoyl-CoA reductase-like NADH-dependent reductase (Old Yellow Enzyme family)